MYPYRFNMGQRIQTNAPGVTADRGFVAHLVWENPSAAASDSILADQETSNEEDTIVTEFAGQPDYPRQISITPGGTTADVAAGNILIEGTDAAGNLISEEIAIEENASAAVTSTMAFASITKITFPVQDGAGATFDVGVTDKLGLPYALQHNTVLAAFLNNVREGTAPSVTTDANDWTKNLIDLNSALNGKQVDVYLIV